MEWHSEGSAPDTVWQEVAPGRPEAGHGALSEAQANSLALVLLSRSIPCQLEQDDRGWHLLVPTVVSAAAREELHLYWAENSNWPPPSPPSRPLVENTLATLSVLLLLAAFHNITLLDISLPIRQHIDWLALGSADAAKIRAGEWWRLVTALTLHADWLHLLSNLAIGGIFTVQLCRELGSGLAWSLLLGSGALGNLANAWIHPPSHSSVGASTVVFGAVGILAALTLVRNRHQLQRRWPLPVAAALALLALLGTQGERTDLGAHLFGLLSGTGLGLVTELLLGRFGRPGRGLDALLAAASAAIVVMAWWAALASG
ncbi:MAG: rhomboid family intramembrane serine protease [Geobacter sp.]|nr:rhomboid family intramembrane serine protease [Geobacter sp.]